MYVFFVPMGIAFKSAEKAKLNYTCPHLCITALQSFLLNKQNRKTAGIKFVKNIDMALERNVVFRLDSGEYEALQAAATRRGVTVSALLRGFVALVSDAPKVANHDQPLAELLDPTKKKRKGSDRPLSELLKSR